MFRRIKRSAHIGAAYLSALGQLAALEVRVELQRVIAQARYLSIAIALAVFGFGWINVGVFVWVWQSPYRLWAPFAIGAGLAILAALFWRSVRVMRRQPIFTVSRQALLEDLRLWDIDLVPEHVLQESTPAQQAQEAIDKVNAQYDETMIQARIKRVQNDLDQLRRALYQNVAGRSSARSKPSSNGRPSGAEHSHNTTSTADKGPFANAASAATAGTTPGPSSAAHPVRSQPTNVWSPEVTSEANAAGSDVSFNQFVPKSRTMRMAFTLAAQVNGVSDPAGNLVTAVAKEWLFQRKIPVWVKTTWPVLRIAMRMVADNRRAERLDRLRATAAKAQLSKHQADF